MELGCEVLALFEWLGYGISGGLPSYSLTFLLLRVGTGWGGSWRRLWSFTFGVFLFCWEGIQLSPSLGKGFGGQGLLVGFLFLFGWRRGGKYSLEITWGGEVISLWIGVACAGVMGNQWTIFWSIVRVPIMGGALFLDHLGCLGSSWESTQSFDGMVELAGETIV